MLPSLPPLGSTADIERAIGSLVNAVLTTKEEKLTWVARVLSTLAYDCLSRAEKGLVRLYLQQKTGYSRAQVARMILSAHREILTKTIRAHRFLEYVTTPKGFALLGCALVTVLALHGSDRSVADILGVSKTDAIRHHIRMLETQPADSSAEQPHVAVTPTAEIRTMQARVDQRRASRMNAEGITVSPEVFVPTETTAPSPNTASTANAAVPSTELTAKNSRLWDILGVGSEGQVLMIQHGQPTWGTLAVHMAAPAEPVRFAPANRGGGGGGSEAPSRRGGGGSENATSTNTNTTTTITTTVTTANGWTSATGLVYLTTTGDAVGIGTATPETKLEVIGTVSGSLLHAQDALTSSGTFVFEGAASGSSLYLASAFNGAGLTDCSNSSSSKLLWNSSTGRFSCGTDQTVGTGLSISTGDARYLKDAGGTLTGVLAVTVTGGNNATVGINVVNAISGAVIHAEKTLTTSGTLVFEGAASGASLYIGTSFNGAGLVTCSNATTSKLLWNSSTGRFSCGTDAGIVFGSGQVFAIGDARYLKQSGGTLTGALTVNVTGGTKSTTGLNVVNTISGAIVHGEKTLTSSGTLVFEGAASGSSLYLGTSLNGAGLTSCSTGSTSKLLWNSSTGRFSCGTDTDTTYTAGQGLTLASTALSLNATLTGTMIKFQTLSGNTLNIQANNTSYIQGNTVIGIATTADTKLEVIGTASGTVLYANKTLASSGTLVFKGAGSGASLYIGTNFQGAGLTDCDTAGSSKLLWDATTGRFSCGSDQNSGGSSSFSSGNLFAIGDARYLKQSGGTVTGALTVNITGGNKNTIAINVVNTISGAIVHGEKTLTSSGTLVFEGAASGASLYLGTSLNGAGLTTCSDGTASKLLWNSSTGRFSCGTDQTVGSGLSQSAGDERYINTAGDTMTGSLTLNITGGVKSTLAINAVNTISGAILHAEKTLTSSGTLVFEGAASGSSLYLGTSLTGAGLSSCSNGTTSKLLWNSTTGRFSCGTDTDTNTTYTVGQGLTLTSTVIRLNATVTGSLVQAVTTLASSGTLVFEGAASGSSLYLGTSLNGAGLTDCDTAGSSKLLWDATTGRFSCGSDQNSGGGSSFSSGQLLTIGNARYLSKAGGTATGALMVNITGGVKSTVGLNVVNTISGAILHAEKTLTSSGTFVFEGAASGSSLYLGTSLQGAGLTDCDTAGSSKLLWDTTTGRFSCGSDQGGGGLVIKKKTVDENLTDDNTLQNDDELYFAVAANETWVYRFSLKTTTGDTIAAWKFAVAAPASSTCQMTVTLIENNVAPQNGNSSTCGAAVSISPATTTDETVEVFGSIKTAGTAGSGSLQWAQNAVQMGMTNTVYAGSMLTAFKTVGSDLAEVYQTREANLLPGMVVALDSTLTAGVKMSAVANDPHILGVLSTKPALVIGGDDLEGGPGLPVFVALSGRVPVMVSTENGAIRPGDFLTSSSKKGIAMRATRVGAPVIGQAMTGYDGEEVGVVTIFIKNTSLAIDPSIEPLTGSGTPLASSGSVLPISNHSGSFVDMVSAEVTKQIDAFKIQWISEQRATSNEQPVLSGSQLEADTLSLEHTLTVGTDARIAGDLHVEGSFVISDLIVPGALHIDQLGTHVTGLLAADTLTISSGALIHGTLTLGGDVNLENGSVRFGSGTVTLDHLIARESLFVLGNITIQGLATFLGDVAVHGELSVSPKQAGFAVIPSSETSVTVLFGTGFRLTPVVTASPDTPILYAVSQTTQTGFVIHLAAPNSEPVRFSWHALSTEILSSSSLPLRSSEGAEGGQSSEPILSDVGSSSSENSVTLSTVEGSSESSSSSISSLSSSEQSSSSQESLASAQSSDEAGSESLSSASSSAE